MLKASVFFYPKKEIIPSH